MRQFKPAFDKIGFYLFIKILRRLLTGLNFALLPSHNIIMIQKKNFNIRISSQIWFKNHIKKPSNLTSLSRKSKESSLEQARLIENQRNMVKKVQDLKLMIYAMGMQSSESSILKHLKKLMDSKSYHYKMEIMQILKTGSFLKTEEKAKQYNFQHMQAEIEKLKQQLQMVLLKRFSRDVEVMEARIFHSNQLIRQHLDLTEYERLVCSFRPSLISNPSDIARELQDICNATATPVTQFNHIQQLRYQRLSRTEAQICQLHTKVCKEKEQTKIFLY